MPLNKLFAARLSRIFTPLVFIGVLAGGCAQQVGDIDRTDSNRIEKTAFEGEWYMLQTVVDVNGTAISAFIGNQGQMERVRFDIEEDHLIAYNTHEDVIGIDTHAHGSEDGRGSSADFGRPVASFGINSHFDIQRQYNSSTGEQTNVIVENTSDRLWFERDFIRVDWSTNEIETIVDPIIPIAELSSISISAQDEGDEITWFVERNEDEEVVYIDVLSQYIIEPDFLECALTFGYPLWGAWCGPETVTVRTSFAKILEESDYIPLEYSDLDMNDFGLFRITRATYDEHYGPSDAGEVNIAARWNMWERNRNDDGSIIPIAERVPGQIVYYLNEEWPEDLKHVAYDVAEMYDNAFRRVAAAYRGIDIPSDPRQMNTIGYDVVPRIFYLCDNPGGTDGAFEMSNEGYANGICQRPGEVKNLGDVRFSFFNYILTNQQSGPGGYGPSSQDPLTGETVQAAANIYGAGYERGAQYMLDLAKIMTGELDAYEYGFGSASQDYFDHLASQTDDDLYRDMIRDGSAQVERLRETATEVLARPRVRNMLQRDISDFRVRNAAQTNPLELIRGTELERMAILPEMERHLMPPTMLNQLVDGTLDLSNGLEQEQIDALSLASVGDPTRLVADHRRRMLRLTHHGAGGDCILMTDFSDPFYLGLARELAAERQQLLAEGMTIEEIDAHQHQYLLEASLRDTLAHEVGHTVGLMHNFEASFDALNYGPEYWALRQKTFNTCDPDYVTFSVDGFLSGQLAPPLCDDAANETQAQYDARNAALFNELIDGRIHDYEVSSTMDYAGVRNYSINWDGLGLYDYAAIAFSYGNLVEVFDQTPSKISVRVNYDPTTDEFINSTVSRSDLPIRTFDDVDDFFISRRNLNEGDDARYLPREEGGHEHSYKYYHYSMLPVMFGGNVDAMHDRSLVPVDQVGQLARVPYRYCHDFEVGTSVECQYLDAGADYLESFQRTRDRWDEYYYSYFFRRNRASFGLYLYPFLSSAFNYTMAPMARLYQYWFFRAANRGYAWYGSEWGGLDNTLAAFAGLDWLSEVIMRPSVGTYYFDEDEDMYLNIDHNTGYEPSFDFEIVENIDPSHDYLDIGLDSGRYMFELYREDDYQEVGWLYWWEPQVLSWFWAKWAAMMALVMPEVEILGADSTSDYNAYSLPVYLIFPEEMTAFFGALPREDFSRLSVCVERKDGGREADDIMYRSLISGTPSGCNNAESLNPYTATYGNSDFNMRLLSTLYAAAYFQTNYSSDWFDQANIYIVGRGYNIEPAEGHTLVVYEHDNGVQYAAMVPEVMDLEVDDDIYVGMQFIYDAQELRDQRDAEFDANGESSEYWSLYWDLNNLLEDMRFLSQANELFEGYNVFVPSTL